MKKVFCDRCGQEIPDGQPTFEVNSINSKGTSYCGKERVDSFFYPEICYPCVKEMFKKPEPLKPPSVNILVNGPFAPGTK